MDCDSRFASGVTTPHPVRGVTRHRGAMLTHRRTPLTLGQKRGGLGDTSPKRVRARGPVAKRIYAAIRIAIRRRRR